jgi:ATP-dependent Clp protease adapter protein ClpS
MKNGRLMARIIGGVSLAFGIGSAILAVWAIDRQFAIRGGLQTSAAMVILVFLIIAAFSSLVGYRLLFNRPNRNGSILSPTGWKMLALCFCIVGLTIAAIGLGRREYRLFGVALGLGVLGLGSIIAGRAASATLLWSPVFPPDTSLLRMDGFVPAGFSCGIEFLNDNRTPMAFVVAVLQNCMGLSETNATRMMLEIHTKGGALIPMASIEESKRVVELVSSTAQASSHPLVCRAVTVE